MPQKNDDAYREYQRGYYQRVRKKQRNNRKVELMGLVGGARCSKCGYDKNSAALDFHHLDPTIKDFGIATTFQSLENMKEEIKKCVVLCKNCHAEHHHPELALSSNG